VAPMNIRAYVPHGTKEYNRTYIPRVTEEHNQFLKNKKNDQARSKPVRLGSVPTIIKLLLVDAAASSYRSG
jgi:hypothetical protein